MPRLQVFYSDFFYDPLTDDVEELLAYFQQRDSVRYQEFSAIWREMRFSDVFLGLIRGAEMKRFIRVALATAVTYFLPPYSYQIRVGGLYLMFGFFHTQPAVPPVKIRLALRDWEQVQKFLKDSVDSGHHDVVYIYEKLVAAKAIHYTAMPHALAFQKQKNPKREHVCAEFLGRTTAVQELMSSDLLEEMSNIQTRYEKLKEATVEVRTQLSTTSRVSAACLKENMMEFITWQQKTYSQDKKDKNSGDEDDDEEDHQAEDESSSRARLLASIKQKSYSSCQEAPKSRRHRQAQVVESSSSGPEQQVQEASLRKKKPPSLRARTWQSLGRTQETSMAQAWLLSAPEQTEGIPLKRMNQAALHRG